MPSGLLGFVVGLAYGYVAQRGSFCLNSGFRSAFTDREFTKVKALAAAIGIQMVLLPLVFLTGVVSPTVPSLHVAGALGGGLLFGASMRWAAGCAAGVVFKIGGRSTSALWAALGMVAGASALEVGPLRAVRDILRGPEVTTEPMLGFEMAGLGGALSLVLGAAILAWLWPSPMSTAGDWTWRRTGVALGVVSVLSWIGSGVAGRNFGLAVIPGAVGMVGGVAQGPSAVPVFDVALVIGVAAGAAIASVGRGASFSRLSWRDALKRWTGGVGLGVGASLAAGCTVGHGLTGLPLLAPGSVLTMIAIFVGANLTPIAKKIRPPPNAQAEGAA